VEFDANEANASDVIDERGQSSGGSGLGGLGGSGGGGAGLGLIITLLTSLMGRGKGGKKSSLGLIVLLVVGVLIFRTCSAGGGFDLGSVLNNLNKLPNSQAADGQQLPATGNTIDLANDPQAADVQFANVVISDANDVWTEAFRTANKSYTRTKLVLYTDAVDTGCGSATSSVGPFYCPADQRVYLDLSFWNELQQRFGADGDFAQAYVIAHEVGHHVQQQLGISAKVSQEERADPGSANGAAGLSVRTELQADCLAGVWAHSRYERGTVQAGDIDEAINAAKAVGDDTIQKESVGSVRPDTFTHGESKQRAKWFKAGFDSGSSDDCDTFSVDEL